jgi:hypothetical protein
MYVLVLGLDVLGNPFGVIRGLAEGIEDLFYEPYQGAIQGPEEFAEGLALGVKSMFGHAVGEHYISFATERSAVIWLTENVHLIARSHWLRLCCIIFV